ncbi:MAG: hypothetical protein AAF731_06110 [Bacteroidota bacterium]
MKDIICFLFLPLFLLCSCGEKVETPPVNPIQTSKNSNYLNLLDEEGNAWHYNIREDVLTKVEASDLRSLNISNDEAGVTAVNHSGALYYWSMKRPNKVEGAEAVASSFAMFKSLPPKSLTDGSLIEYDIAGLCDIFLMSDGTLTTNCPKLKEDLKPLQDIRTFALLPFGRGIFGGLNPSITLLAIDKNGDVFFGHKSDANSDDWVSSKVEGLAQIEKVGFCAKNNGFPFYAIDEEGTYYILPNLEEIFTLKGKSIVADMGNSSEGQALIDKEGNILTVYNEKGNPNLKISEEVNPTPFGKKIYAFKFTRRAVVILEEDGTLTRYHNRGFSSFKYMELEKPRRIGDFKINMDYYRLKADEIDG